MEHCQRITHVSHTEIPCADISDSAAKATPESDIDTAFPVFLLLKVLNQLLSLTDSNIQCTVFPVALLSCHIGICGKDCGERSFVFLEILLPFRMHLFGSLGTLCLQFTQPLICPAELTADRHIRSLPVTETFQIGYSFAPITVAEWSKVSALHFSTLRIEVDSALDCL